MKKCSKCGSEKETTGFYTRVTRICKECAKEYAKEYKKTEKAQQYKREYSKRPEVRKKVREYTKEYEKRESYKEKRREYRRKKYREDVQYKLKRVLRRRFHKALKKGYKHGSVVDSLGCTTLELKNYLQNKFKDGMSWENHGEWHIDHIRPLSGFDLTDREQFLKACHYTNLQPLWAKENIMKSNK